MSAYQVSSYLRIILQRLHGMNFPHNMVLSFYRLMFLARSIQEKVPSAKTMQWIKTATVKNNFTRLTNHYFLTPGNAISKTNPLTLYVYNQKYPTQYHPAHQRDLIAAKIKLFLSLRKFYFANYQFSQSFQNDLNDCLKRLKKHDIQQQSLILGKYLPVLMDYLPQNQQFPLESLGCQFGYYLHGSMSNFKVINHITIHDNYLYYLNFLKKPTLQNNYHATVEVYLPNVEQLQTLLLQLLSKITSITWSDHSKLSWLQKKRLKHTIKTSL